MKAEAAGGRSTGGRQAVHGRRITINGTASGTFGQPGVGTGLTVTIGGRRSSNGNYTITGRRRRRTHGQGADGDGASRRRAGPYGDEHGDGDAAQALLTAKRRVRTTVTEGRTGRQAITITGRLRER